MITIVSIIIVVTSVVVVVVVVVAEVVVVVVVVIAPQRHRAQTQWKSQPSSGLGKNVDTSHRHKQDF